MHGKGVQVLFHRHSCAGAEFLRMSAQQFDAVIVEPLGTSESRLPLQRFKKFDNSALICLAQVFKVLCHVARFATVTEDGILKRQ
jgi:hypothetical protein